MDDHNPGHLQNPTLTIANYNECCIVAGVEPVDDVDGRDPGHCQAPPHGPLHSWGHCHTLVYSYNIRKPLNTTFSIFLGNHKKFTKTNKPRWSGKFGYLWTLSNPNYEHGCIHTHVHMLVHSALHSRITSKEIRCSRSIKTYHYDPWKSNGEEAQAHVW